MFSTNNNISVPPETKDIVQGEIRNSKLIAIADALQQKGISESEIIATLLKINGEICLPPLDPVAVIQIGQGASRNAVSSSGLFTDIWNAARFIECFGNDLKYSHQLDKWFIWTGQRYLMDEIGAVVECAKETIKQMYIEAAKKQGGTDYINALKKHASKSAMSQRLNAMINLAKSDPRIVIKIEDLDSNPWLLNCENGTLNLKTGELQPHTKSDLITKMISVSYNPKADCPLFIDSLNKIINNRPEMLSYLQRIIGYCLTGDNREQCMFLCYGAGNNGKTTLLELLRDLLGDYARNADTESFTAHFYQTIKNDIARLKDSRFVTAAETESGMKLSESLIKQITGGDMMTVRFLHQEHFEFKPTFKIFMSANHKPQIKGGDSGIWRKIRLIPFEVIISADDRDYQLLEKLKKELPGILNWALKGCLEWQKSGLNDPSLVTDATAQYREDMDELLDYFEDACNIGNNECVKVKDLYINYKNWCSMNSHTIIKKSDFKLKVEARGFRQQKNKGDWYWMGISIKDNSADINAAVEDNTSNLI